MTELEPHKKFVEMCQILRVLNAVRDYTVGVPLTLVQYPLTMIIKIIMSLYSTNIMYT